MAERMLPVLAAIFLTGILTIGSMLSLEGKTLGTEGPSKVTTSLDPQPALIGEDVQIRCTLVQIIVRPRIAVNDKEEALQSLAYRDKYTLTRFPTTNGVAVYVLTLRNVSVSDNGTRFECFVRSPGRIITSGTRVLRVVQERITVNEETCTKTTVVSKSVDITVLTLMTETWTNETVSKQVFPTNLANPESPEVVLNIILIPVLLLAVLLIIAFIATEIWITLLVKRRQVNGVDAYNDSVTNTGGIDGPSGHQDSLVPETNPAYVTLEMGTIPDERHYANL